LHQENRQLIRALIILKNCDNLTMEELKEDDYCFVIIDKSTDRSVKLEVRLHDDVAQRHLQSVWQRLYVGLQEHHKICGRSVPDWAMWKPWDWCQEKRIGFEYRVKYIAWCGDLPVGFFNVWENAKSAHTTDKTIIYLEHIAVGPNGQSTEIWRQRFQYIGSALFAYIIFLSQQHGYAGRVGLHVASDEALGFYQRLNEKCDRQLFYPERTGISGPTPRGQQETNKTYLETQESGASLWLENYRHA